MGVYCRKNTQAYITSVGYWLVFLGLVAFGSVASAQPTWKLEVDGKVEDSDRNKKLEGASIQILKNGSEVQKIFSSAAGTYKVSLEPNFEYLIKITKQGYVTKIFSVNTKNVPSEEDSRPKFSMSVEVGLFKMRDGLDVSVLDSPIGKIFYVQSAHNFGFDEAYTKAIQNKLEQLRQDLEKKMAEEAAAAAELAKKKVEFDKLINQGKASITAKKYDAAIGTFNEALALKIDDAAAQTLIAEATRLKAEEDAKKKAEEDAKKKAEEDAKAKAEAEKKRAEFNKLIQAGDDKLAAKKFDDALAQYNAALATKVDDPKANDKISAAQKAKQDEENRLKKEAEDKAKAELDAKAKAEAEKKKAEFDKIIKEGDAKLKEQKFDEALTQYNAALALHVDDAAANAKIKAAQDAKTAAEEAKRKAEEDAKNKAEAEKRKAEFDALIKQGDSELKGKQFDASIATFQKALAMNLDNATAQAKLDAANKAKADEDAKKKAEEDAKNKAEAEKKKAEFDKAIKEGETKLKDQKFEEALSQFNDALAMKVDDALATAKIKEVQDAKNAAEEAKRKAEEDAKNKAEAEKRKAEFDALIKQGDGELKEKQFDASVSTYQKALAMNLDNATAQAKLDAANKAKADEEARKKAEEDAKNKAENEKKRAEFDKQIKEGDDKLKDNKFDEALTQFNAALSMQVDDALANSKIKEAQDAKSAAEEAKRKAEEDAKNKAEAEKRKAEFDALIKQGDGELKDKQFDASVSTYQKALAMNLDNATAQAKLDAANKAKADEEARKKAEEDAKNKEEAERKRVEFDKLIKDGDGKLKDQKFDEAITQYNAALAMQVDDALAGTKIKEAQDAKSAAEDAKRKAEEDAKNKADAEKRKAEFDALVKQGDGELKEKQFDAAIATFQKALEMGVDNAAAQAKIEAANKAKADEEARKKAEEDAKNKAEAEKKRAEFDKLIKDGDGKLKDQKFDEAIVHYTNALALQVDDALANAKVKEAQDAKANAEEARRKAEEDAKNKAEAEKKKAEFEELVKQGDAALKSKQFDAAQTNFQKGLEMNVDNALAQLKLDAVKKAREEEEARLKAEQDAKNKAEAEKKKADFEKLIKEGDGKLKDKKFDEAITNYGNALALQVDDALANAKIKEAQEAKAADEDARKKAEEAAKLKEEQAKKLEEFKQLIASGDDQIKSKSFAGAISSFEKALAMSVDNALATAKIEEAKKAQFDEEARVKAAEEAQNKAAAERRKADFDKLIRDGEGKLKDKRFDEAIAYFNDALKLEVDNNLAEQKIKEAENLRNADDEARKKAEEERLKKEEAESAKRKFDGLIREGDAFMSGNLPADALSKFEEALSMNLDNATATKKIEEAKKRIAELDAKNAADKAAKEKAEQEKKQREFDSMIASGDRELKQKEFDLALLSFNKALETGINNALAQDRIALVNKAKEEYEAKLRAEEEAREKAEREAREKAEREKRKAEFDVRIKQGTTLVSVKNYEDAIYEFQAALDLNIDNFLAEQKLSETKGLKDKADKEARSKAFMKKIADGNNFFKLKNYELALDYFKAALELNVDNAKAQEWIDKTNAAWEADKLAEEKRRALMDEAARKKAEAEEKERLFLERKRKAEEEAKQALIARLEAQQKALAMTDKFKEQNKKEEKQESKPVVDEVLSRADLAKKYPQGVTSEEIDGPNYITTRVVVVNGTVGDEYKKIKYNWGQVYFKKNGKDISEALFKKETGL